MTYPYFAPIILTDQIYLDSGGHTGTSTANQRNAAYLIAEKRMTSHLNTFLKPTVVTGTYEWPHMGEPIILDQGYLISIKSVKAISQDSFCDCDLTESDACGLIKDDTYGYVYVRVTEGAYRGCGCGSVNPWQLRIAYEAGLPSGTVYQADMLLALTIVAELTLNEMIDQGANEGVGDVQITEFSNQSYREKRGVLGHTGLGSSARANYAADLVGSYRRHRWVKLGI